MGLGAQFRAGWRLRRAKTSGGFAFSAGNSKNVEIIVARKIVFDIFRAPFDRNKCAGIWSKNF
jgi:hypothetical protein